MPYKKGKGSKKEMEYLSVLKESNSEKSCTNWTTNKRIRQIKLLIMIFKMSFILTPSLHLLYVFDFGVQSQKAQFFLKKNINGILKIKRGAIFF